MYNNLGEPYIDNKITFYNCDCMELMKQTPDRYYELAIIDPPYALQRFKNGIGKNDRHTIKTTDNRWNNNAPTKEYFLELFRISKNQIVFGANNFEMPPTEYFLIWNKLQTVDNFASAEYAFVSMGLKKPAKVFDYSIHQHNSEKMKFHPTQKPVRLYTWLLANYAKAGDKILDTHVGSASSLIACHQLGFEVVGCELDREYYDLAVDRIRNTTAQMSLF